MIIAPGTTNVTTYFKLVDPSAGTPETGLTITDLDATYVRDGAAASKSDLTALAAADSAHADNKAYEVDGTNCPGLYRVDWPDAAFAAGVDRVQLCVNGSEIDPAYIEVELLDLASIDANVDAILDDTGTNGVVIADGGITAAKIATDAITAAKIAADAITSSELAATAATEIADAVLTRDWTSVTGEAARSVLNALRFLRNKWSISSTTLTVCEEDDSTTAWTGTVQTSSAADPIISNDPS